MFKDHLEQVDRLELVDQLSEDQNKELGREFISASAISELLTGRVDYMLVGAHAVGRLTKEPRATKDIDIVVSDIGLAKSLLLKKYPHLKVRGDCLVDRAGQSVVDIFDADHPVYRAAMSKRRLVGSIPLPSIESILVLKFLSARSPLREKGKKLQDRADFYKIAADNVVDLKLAEEVLRRADEWADFEDFQSWLADVRS
jgi:hypothetical protein